MASIILPTVPTGPTSINPNRLVLYGPPKVGKTELCSRLPNNLIIDLENGSGFVTGLKYAIKLDGTTIGQRFVEMDELIKTIIAAGKPYTYGTIDTGTELEAMCEWEATKTYMDSVMGKTFNTDDSGRLKPREKWESVLSLPNGAGYLWLRLSFAKWLDKFQEAFPHLIIICHLKDKLIEKKGKEVSSKDVDLSGKIRSITFAKADSIGYMYREGDAGENLRINFQSSETIISGSRPVHLRGVDIEADWNKIFLPTN